MGGIYARDEGLPEEVWKAIYFHYLPIGVEADAPPTRAQLGKAAVTWAAVSLADKLDTIVGLFAAGEKPTGSRDPYGLRRAAQGVVKMLVDLPELTGRVDGAAGSAAVARGGRSFGACRDNSEDARRSRVPARAGAHLLERRGFRPARSGRSPITGIGPLDAAARSRRYPNARESRISRRWRCCSSG